MKTLKKLTTYLPVIYLAGLFSSCGGVEGIDIKMNIPVTVDANEEFVTQITVTNTLNNSQTLLSIDIGDNYLEGIALLKTEPNFTDQMHISIDNSVSYSFGKEIGPQDSITINLYWKALSEGEFSDDIDFCINSNFTFISKGARTKVGGENGNTTTERTTKTAVETVIKDDKDNFDAYEFLDHTENFTDKILEFEMYVEGEPYRPKTLQDFVGKDVKFYAYIGEHRDKVVLTIHIPEDLQVPKVEYGSTTVMVKFKCGGSFEKNTAISIERI